MSDVLAIHEALAAVSAKVGAVAKKDRNTVQNFSFRGIDAVVNAVAPALQEFGVVVVPHLEGFTFDQIEVGKEGKQVGHVLVDVTYTFVGPGGDSIAARVLGEAMDSGDKAVPKAMSVAFRTALLQALTLPTDEVDPDSEVYERAQVVPASSPRASEKAVKAIWAKSRAVGWDHDTLISMLVKRFGEGAHPDTLTKAQATLVLDGLTKLEAQQKEEAVIEGLGATEVER